MLSSQCLMLSSVLDLTSDPGSGRMSLHERINKTLLLGQSYPGMPGMVWGLPTLPPSSMPPIPVSPLSPVSPFLPSWCLQSLILQSQANFLAHHLNINVQNSSLYGKNIICAQFHFIYRAILAPIKAQRVARTTCVCHIW